jgi:hypothetical protein
MLEGSFSVAAVEAAVQVFLFRRLRALRSCVGVRYPSSPGLGMAAVTRFRFLFFFVFLVDGDGSWTFECCWMPFPIDSDGVVSMGAACFVMIKFDPEPNANNILLTDVLCFGTFVYCILLFMYVVSMITHTYRNRQK